MSVVMQEFSISIYEDRCARDETLIRVAKGLKMGKGWGEAGSWPLMSPLSQAELDRLRCLPDPSDIQKKGLARLGLD
jgi:hypothetical protein